MEAECKFVVSDVKTLFGGLTDEEAEKWLDRNGKHIAEAMCEAGWAAIHDLGLMDGLEPTGGE